MTHPCVALEECCEFLDHIRRPVKESERVNGPYPYFGANGQQGWINDYLFDEPLVLLAEDGGHFSNPERGIAYKISGKTWVNNHAHVLRPREGIIDVDYLAHALKNKNVRRHLSGSTRDKLTKAGACQIEIPLPPLEEQRRIAAILDKCHESELLATKATSLYSSLCKASFHSFLRQVEDRESIPHVPLSSVCTRITKGTTPSSLGLPDAEGDIPFVRVQDIDRNVLIAESVALQIPVETHHALSRSMLQSGDILVSIAGTIGRVCEVRGLPPHGANCNQAVAIARPIFDVVRPLFLKCLLSDGPAQKQMRAAGVTGTITNLSLGQLGGIKIPLPSIEAQDRICDQLERLADIGERFQNGFVTAKRLTDSLTSFLMSGT